MAVIQNDTGNEFAPTVIVVPLTTKSFSKEYPVNVHLPKTASGLKEDSTVLLSQIRTLDKKDSKKNRTSPAGLSGQSRSCH